MVCSFCNNEKATLRCSRCKEASYCNKECQKEHFKIHKKDCKPFNDPKIMRQIFQNDNSDKIETFSNKSILNSLNLFTESHIIGSVYENEDQIYCGILGTYALRTEVMEKIPRLKEYIGESKNQYIGFTTTEIFDHRWLGKKSDPIGRIVYSGTWKKPDKKDNIVTDTSIFHINRRIGKIIDYLPDNHEMVIVLIDDDYELFNPKETKATSKDKLKKGDKIYNHRIDGEDQFIPVHKTQPTWLKNHYA